MDICLILYDYLKKSVKLLQNVNFTEEEKYIYLQNKIPSILLNPLHSFSEEKIDYVYTYDAHTKSLELEYYNKND